MAGHCGEEMEVEVEFAGLGCGEGREEVIVGVLVEKARTFC